MTRNVPNKTAMLVETKLDLYYKTQSPTFSPISSPSFSPTSSPTSAQLCPNFHPTFSRHSPNFLPNFLLPNLNRPCLLTNMSIIWAELGGFETMSSLCVKLISSYNHPPSTPLLVLFWFFPRPHPPKSGYSSLAAGANLEWHGERVQ